MQPNLPSSAPPPVNPYDFLSSPQKQKRSLLPTGSSKKQRIMFVVIGLIGLLIAGMIIASVLNSTGSSTKQDLLTAAKQQQELIRVAAIGYKKARGPMARNLAVTTQLTIQSDHVQLQPILKKEGVKADVKTLASGKNLKTDQALTSADQANRFDEALVTSLQSQINEYQKTLKNIHDASPNQNIKNVVNRQFVHASQLLTIK